MCGVAGRGPMIRPWPSRTPLRVGRSLSTLAVQFLHTCSDYRKIIGSTGTGHISSIHFLGRFLRTGALYNRVA